MKPNNKKKNKLIEPEIKYSEKKYTKTIYNCMLYLMACGIHGMIANEEALTGINLKHLFILSKKHSVAAMVCYALENTKVFIFSDEDIKQKWIDAKVKAIRKNMLLDAEYKVLVSAMEEQGIWYMPLKGIILKEWYPKAGMREMADYDILIDPSKRKQVKKIFMKRDYKVIYYNQGNHDVYEKRPVYNYEIHTSLFHSSQRKLARQYANVKEKLFLVENFKYQYSFTPEDFYIFITVHAYKHYSENGIGVRALADFYIIMQKFGDSLNVDYIEKELKKIGIGEFEKDSRILAEKIFGSRFPLDEVSLAEKENKMLQSYLEAGTFGTTEKFVKNKFENLDEKGNNKVRAKLKYIVYRIFPNMDFVKDSYPTVYKHPYIYPIFWLWRLICKPFLQRDKIKNEVKSFFR